MDETRKDNNIAELIAYANEKFLAGDPAERINRFSTPGVGFLSAAIKGSKLLDLCNERGMGVGATGDGTHLGFKFFLARKHEFARYVSAVTVNLSTVIDGVSVKHTRKKIGRGSGSHMVVEKLSVASTDPNMVLPYSDLVSAAESTILSAQKPLIDSLVVLNEALKDMTEEEEDCFWDSLGKVSVINPTLSVFTPDAGKTGVESRVFREELLRTWEKLEREGRV